MRYISYKSGSVTPRSRQAGLSLVELMISLTIGLILLAGMTSLIVRQNSTRDEMEKSSRQIENGRYAIQLLRDDIEHAGFYGEYAPSATTVYTVPADPCSTSTAAATQGWNPATPTVPVAIQGYGGSSTAPACAENRKAGTALLVVRRMSTATTTVAEAAAADAAAGTSTILFQVSKCNAESATPFMFGTGGFVLHKKDCTSVPPGTLATLRRYILRIYYVSTCNVCTPTPDNIPTLKMVEFTNGGQSVVPLVEGIEELQFDYGVDSTNDGAPDDYFAAAGVASWQDVMTVRVHLLARNNEPTPGYVDTKSYMLGVGAAPTTPGGAYKRRVFSELVRANNLSGRRES